MAGKKKMIMKVEGGPTEEGNTERSRKSVHRICHKRFTISSTT
jgi:hypothetical protein